LAFLSSLPSPPRSRNAICTNVGSKFFNHRTRMTIPKSLLTFVVNISLAMTSVVLAYLTNWMILIPILFGLGIPLINIDKPYKVKIGMTLFIILVSTFIFFTSIMTLISFNGDTYVFPGFVVGTSGVLILVANGLVIDSVKINTKTILVTFLLSGLSLPIWIIMTKNMGTIMGADIIRQFGAMMFWMTSTTVGITIGIEEKKPTANNGYETYAVS